MIITLILLLVISFIGTKEIKQEVLKQSPEEILVNNIKTYKETILKTETDINQANLNLKTYKLKQACYKAQLDRLVNGLEYSIDYCLTDENLQKFEEGL